jgi:hypothetical protein
VRGRCLSSLSPVATATTQIEDIAVSRGSAKFATGIILFLGILLFLNYGVARLSDLLAFRIWPSHETKKGAMEFSMLPRTFHGAEGGI